ncbi:hypothetical protein M3231_13370 [Neobacillus mesonae]|nr:hypothetical protein [Neobacillus mesonae]
MTKLDHNDWKRYIQGEMTGAEREELDRLLLENEEALDSYLMALERHSMSSLSDADSFTTQVMEQVQALSSKQEKQVRKSNRFRHLLNNKIVHYTLAASITMLFISTGVFDRVAPGNFDIGTEDKKPYSEKMMEKATGWLDEIKPDPYTK